MTSGVYRIVNRVTEKSYVGSSGDVQKRWTRHQGQLRRGVHHSEKLQRAWAKYGAEAFYFEVLEHCSIQQLRECEQRWIDQLDTYHGGYNCTAIAREHTAEVRARLSTKKRGTIPTESTRRKMSEAHKGKMSKEEVARRLHTPEARKKAADAKRGIPLDDTRKRILSSPEVQQRAAASRTGVKRGPYKPGTGPDGRKKPMSPEHRAKLTGRVVSEETRKKQSEAAKARCKRSTHA